MKTPFRSARFLAGFAVLWAVLAGLAELAPPGRYGVLVLAGVLLTALVVERLLSGSSRGVLAMFGRPAAPAVIGALAIALLLQAVFPLVTLLTGAEFALKPGWPWLLVGWFAFHGLAEELVWRGYAFRRLREGRSFTAAALLTMPLIAVTHIPIIVTAGPVIGVAAMLVAAVTSLPLARLFESGRNTLWAAAVVHTGIDAFRVVDVSDADQVTFSLAVAAFSLTVPLLALAFRRTPRTALTPRRSYA